MYKRQALDLNNPALFEKEQVQEELAGNFEARETVSSGYVRFDSKITDRIELMSGLRIENTNLAYTGRTYDADEDITGKTERQRNSYINFLPSLLVKWNVNDDFRYAVHLPKHCHVPSTRLLYRA